MLGAGGYMRMGSAGGGGPMAAAPMMDDGAAAGEGGMEMDEKPKAPQRVYIDYDDPTQFDREGHRITGLAAAQNQLHLQQQLKQNHGMEQVGQR